MASFGVSGIAIFFIYAIFIVRCQVPLQNGASEDEFPQELCESLLTNCSCFDYKIINGLICNGTDFSNYAHILSSGKIFEINSTYEITLYGINYLPARLLEGLIVFRLTLNDPDMSEIDKDAFGGVIRLRRFHVRNSQVQEIPDFRIVKDSIRNINIDNSNLTAVAGESLQNLDLLERLSLINNSIRYIAPQAFAGTDNIIIFDISMNLLTSLPPHIFDSWKKLRKLTLTRNQLLHVNQLFAVTHPKFIYLDYNNITDVDSILYDNMTNVETVVLAYNPIEKISTRSFKGKIPNARFLYLDHCLIRQFDSSHYRDLNNLATLDLKYNLIEEISNQTIDFGVNLELNLSGNKITKFNAEMNYRVKRFYFNNNQLQTLGRTLQFTQISEISIASNQLQYLSEQDFQAVHGTGNLELQGNRIEWIDRMAFQLINNDLHYLDLSANYIPSLNGSMKYLSQLKSLNISDNLIETFEEGDFTGLNELSELYLQYNRIKDLTGQLQLLPQVQYLVITHNNIQTLKIEQIPTTLQYIYFEDNPLKCDCRLLPFVLWLNTSDAVKTDIDLCTTLAENDDRHKINASCPDMCSCACAEDGNDAFMSVDCSSNNLTLVPSFLTENFVQIKQDTSPITYDFRRSLIFDQTAYPSFHIHDRVLSIDLENNNLLSLDSAQLPADLIQLYLSNNKLKQLSESILYPLKNLKRVSLSGNPWDCDCNTLGFKKWLLSKMEIVQDVNDTRCSISDTGESALDGKIILTLTDLDLCPADIGLYVSIAFGVLTFLLLCLATKIFYTRYEMNIKVYLYSHGITWVKARDIDHNKQYDAFISFSNADKDFVDNHILPVIRKKSPNTHMCIHYMHFTLGELIHKNIINAVQNSKRTLLVLTKNFIESEWCNMEFEIAYTQAMKDKVPRIIVVKVGDLPKDIPPNIKLYLDSTTYLTWGEGDFWNKLLYVLPTSSAERNTNQHIRSAIFRITENSVCA